MTRHGLVSFEDLVARTDSVFADPMCSCASGLDYWLKELPFFDTSPMANVMGHLALAIPPLEHSSGVSLGVLLTARKNGDGLSFRIAQQLEDDARWQDRRPPIHVAGWITTPGRSASSHRRRLPLPGRRRRPYPRGSAGR